MTENTTLQSDRSKTTFCWTEFINNRICSEFLLMVFLICSIALPLYSQEQTNETGTIRTISSEQGNITLKSVITPQNPYLADDLVMTITGTHSPDYILLAPNITENYGDFEVLETLPSLNTITNQVQTTVFSIKLRPRSSGILRLPPIPVTAQWNGHSTSNNEKQASSEVHLLLPPGEIKIHSDYEKAEAHLDTIKDPFGQLHRWGLYWIIGIVAILIILTITILLIRHRVRQNLSKQIGPILTPSQRALAELQALMDSKIYVRDVREFYLKITGIVRWFLEETTGIRAPEQTTEEFLAEISQRNEKKISLKYEMSEHLKEFLEFSDLVKFAKFHPSFDEIMQGYQSAKIVLETPLHEENNDTDNRNQGVKL